MSHDAERATNLPTAAPVFRSAAAERMRLHRERQRQGLRCVTVELRETEIDTLIKRELLKSEMRNDPYEIREALYAHLDRTLGAMP
jgi:hypothetical protein